MRFPKETRAAIQEAAPNAVTIRWPTGAPEPSKDGIYYMQSLEEAEEAAKKEDKRRQEHPETHAEVMDQMHERLYGEKPKARGKRSRHHRRRPVPRPHKGDPCIKVLSVIICQRGWEATVELFEDPDPVRHTGIKAKVHQGPHPIFGHHVKTELEQEGIVIPKSRREREEEEDALKIEHAASVDRADMLREERKQQRQRSEGRPAHPLAIAALERAKRRDALKSAA